MRITTVYTDDHSQFVRLPEGVKKLQVRARGKDRIISPVGHTWDEFFLNGARASDDFMTDRALQEMSEHNELG